jgi:integrase
VKEQSMNDIITINATVADLADYWLQELRVDGRLERTTVNEYERILRTLVLPRLGGQHLGELTTEQFNEILLDLGARSLNRQRKAKVVTGAMLDAAVALGALERNPVRGSLSISRPRSKAAPLSAGEVDEVRAALRTWLTKNRPGPKASEDMADIIELMMATGARIGEVLALRWRDIDLGVRTVEINATIKTESGLGTYRKSLLPIRLVALPEPAVLVIDRRRGRAAESVSDAVFPTRNGTWQQVNNVERRWRQIRHEAGLEWMTPDLFRRAAPTRPGIQDTIAGP